MGTEIHASAVVDESAVIGAGVVIGANCVIGAGTVIGDGTFLDANVVIDKNVKIGKCNRFYANCAIGRPPQLLGLTADTEYGTLEIGDNNVIREMVTIHPSMHVGSVTKIGNENLIMIGVHIGHDCILEDKIVLSNLCQVSGHCKVETGVWLSGVVLMHQFVTLGKWCYAAGLSGINHDVAPFVMVSGHYPPEVRSINKRGLGRAGLSDESQREVFKAFKRIWKSDEGVFIDRVKKLASEDGLDPEVKYMVDSIIRSNEHRFGRHLELYRD